MPEETKRDKVIRLIREMRNRTVDRGCTPAEAAAFAAKVAEFMERFQIEEAEIHTATNNGTGSIEPEVEVCENKIRTRQRVFNPGRTQVINALADAMSCKCILLHEDGEAVYGITGEVLDCDYVCQISITLIPQLQIMARLEGVEHGYEKAGLVRWANQYLTGAGTTIYARIVKERKERSELKRLESEIAGTALAVITGDGLATIKAKAALEAFKEKYPKTRTTHSHSEFDGTAYKQGQEAGKRVGLNVGIK